MLSAKRALISVYDKEGLVEFAKGLRSLGIEILSTGGTFSTLEGAGLDPVRVADVTGFPEILDGRVKTLHPKIHAGILADRERAAHAKQMMEHGVTPIDIVVVNLYPFRQTANKPGVAFPEVIEMIDIGGPTMVRAAAKNFRGVVVVVDPEDYPQVLAALEESDGLVPEALRQRLALKAFRHTQTYDAAIAAWLEEQGSGDQEEFPAHLLLDLKRHAQLRYGENPHQGAVVYRSLAEGGIFGGYTQLQGKELSYNNLLDIEAARTVIAPFTEPAVAIIKHGNPCGVAQSDTVATAYERALACDPISAFGGIVAVNREVDESTAEAIAGRFVEVVTAPAFSDEAYAVLGKKSALRLVAAPPRRPGGHFELRALEGGFLAQALDDQPNDPTAWDCPTQRQPDATELRALDFAWKVVRSVKSNAIVVTNEYQTVGIGAGQMSRVDSCKLALEKAQIGIAGTVAASDGFFPFRDGVDTLAAAGVKAIVQPGGSKRDDEVVAAADEHGLAMMMTGARHFKH